MGSGVFIKNFSKQGDRINYFKDLKICSWLKTHDKSKNSQMAGVMLITVKEGAL